MLNGKSRLCKWIQTNIVRVSEWYRPTKAERDLYRRKFMPRSTEYAELVHSNPGYALRMILGGKMYRMTHHEFASHDDTVSGPTQERKPSIFDHAEFTYKVDFPKRRLKTLYGKDWVTIPFLSDEVVIVLDELKLSGRHEETLSCIDSSPANLREQNQEKSYAKRKARHKRRSNTDTTESTVKLNKILLNGAAAGDTKLVAKSIRKGANVNARDEVNGTALHAAAHGQHHEVVSLLLAKGADCDIKLKSGRTALHVAAFNGYTGIAGSLLEKGADVNAVDSEYGSVLRAATFLSHMSMLKLLLEKSANVEAEGRDAFKNALLLGDSQMLELLIEKGIDIQEVGPDALMRAVSLGHTDTVRLLLEKGAQVNKKVREKARILGLDEIRQLFQESDR
jgi:ankyrin repeat protein